MSMCSAMNFCIASFPASCSSFEFEVMAWGGKWSSELYVHTAIYKIYTANQVMKTGRSDLFIVLSCYKLWQLYSNQFATHEEDLHTHQNVLSSFEVHPVLYAQEYSLSLFPLPSISLRCSRIREWRSTTATNCTTAVDSGQWVFGGDLRESMFKPDPSPLHPHSVSVY